MNYIVGFNRDRDGYQVAGALAERGHLSTLITDYYEGKSWPPLKALAHRQSTLVPASRVKVVGSALLPQLAFEGAKRMGRPIKFPSNIIDGAIASAVEKEARRRPADGLLVYSNYAWKAFSRAENGSRILFQYHPGKSIITRSMRQDELGHGGWQQELEETDDLRARIEEVEIANATGFICASNFTARGLEMTGVDRSRIRVVPYGAPEVDSAISERRERVFLFVGQGVQRKGLHILLAAWAQVKAPNWILRVVASRLDPAMAPALSGAVNVVSSKAVSSEELTRLYGSSSALVLPSLVEGFGLVLGEALSNGCSIIATSNTGLPDMNLSAPTAREVAPGSISDLAAAMQEHADTFEAGLIDPVRNAVCASERSWAHFRSGIRAAVADLSS